MTRLIMLYDVGEKGETSSLTKSIVYESREQANIDFINMLQQKEEDMKLFLRKQLKFEKELETLQGTPVWADHFLQHQPAAFNSEFIFGGTKMNFFDFYLTHREEGPTFRQPFFLTGKEVNG